MAYVNDLPCVSAGPDIGDPTWKRPALWRAANAALDYLIDRHADSLGPVRSVAQELRDGLLCLFPTLDSLCERTCPECQTPCCRVADARFDLRDLIFTHLVGIAVPPGQPRSDGNSVCRYLGPHGCLLPRLSRPWICTWYLCPQQKRLFVQSDPYRFAQFKASIGRIKLCRKQLEDDFIYVVGA